jgi:hypothetical protein
MAGPIRQPIDLEKLTSYIHDNVPEVKTPLDVKQVSTVDVNLAVLFLTLPASSATANPILHISSQQPMAIAMSCARSRRGNCFRKQLIE